MIEAGVDVIAKAGRYRAKGWKAGDGRWKEAHLMETEAHPAACMDSIVVKGRGSRTH